MGSLWLEDILVLLCFEDIMESLWLEDIMESLWLEDVKAALWLEVIMDSLWLEDIMDRGHYDISVCVSLQVVGRGCDQTLRGYFMIRGHYALSD